MIGEGELTDIFNKLVADESFCRLTCYGENPFGEDKEDITSLEASEFNALVNDVIRFAPQVDDLDSQEKMRICMYKHYTKVKIESSPIRYETIQFDIYTPHRLMRLDKRLYQIENKISSILDCMPLGIGHMDYVDGKFIPITNVSGYSQYVMIFLVQEGRSLRYGRL